MVVTLIERLRRQIRGEYKVYHAGLDWSGDPSPVGSPYYVACIVGLQRDIEAISGTLAEIRHRFGMRAGEEFHAHRMSDAMRSAVIQAGMQFEMRIVALVCDKKMSSSLPSPETLPSISGLRVAERFVNRYPLKSLSCDVEVGGRRQAPFKTTVHRVHRACWPDMKMSVRFRDSKADDLIQMADVTAYCITHLIRKTIKEEAFRQQMHAIRNDVRNVIVGPCGWEEDDLRS